MQVQWPIFWDGTTTLEECKFLDGT